MIKLFDAFCARWLISTILLTLAATSFASPIDFSVFGEYAMGAEVSPCDEDDVEVDQYGDYSFKISNKKYPFTSEWTVTCSGVTRKIVSLGADFLSKDGLSLSNLVDIVRETFPASKKSSLGYLNMDADGKIVSSVITGEDGERLYIIYRNWISEDELTRTRASREKEAKIHNGVLGYRFGSVYNPKKSPVVENKYLDLYKVHSHYDCEFGYAIGLLPFKDWNVGIDKRSSKFVSASSISDENTVEDAKYCLQQAVDHLSGWIGVEPIARSGNRYDFIIYGEEANKMREPKFFACVGIERETELYFSVVDLTFDSQTAPSDIMRKIENGDYIDISGVTLSIVPPSFEVADFFAIKTGQHLVKYINNIHDNTGGKCLTGTYLLNDRVNDNLVNIPKLESIKEMDGLSVVEIEARSKDLIVCGLTAGLQGSAKFSLEAKKRLAEHIKDAVERRIGRQMEYDKCEKSSQGPSYFGWANDKHGHNISFQIRHFESSGHDIDLVIEDNSVSSPTLVSIKAPSLELQSPPISVKDAKRLGVYVRSQNKPLGYFNKNKDKVVIINTGKGVGSGFIVNDAGVTYLYSNEHVVKGGAPFTAQLLDGTELKLGQFQLAADRDVVRFEVNEKIPGMTLFKGDCKVGLQVSVIGNSDGGGVATEVSGSVIGVGPKTLEISAEFVRGNSGSPVVGEDGCVYGVATYAINAKDEKDWVKQGTRFNGVRRFALRLDNIEWKTVDWNTYLMIHSR